MMKTPEPVAVRRVWERALAFSLFILLARFAVSAHGEALEWGDLSDVELPAYSNRLLCEAHLFGEGPDLFGANAIRPDAWRFAKEPALSDSPFPRYLDVDTGAELGNADGNIEGLPAGFAADFAETPLQIGLYEAAGAEQESRLRRGEIVFFISLPVSFLFSLLGVVAFRAANGESGNYTPIEYTYIVLSSVGISICIAASDSRVMFGRTQEKRVR